MSSAFLKFSGSMASRGPTTISPALLIRTSIPPRTVAICSIVDRTEVSLSTSQIHVVTVDVDTSERKRQPGSTTAVCGEHLRSLYYGKENPVGHQDICISAW